jgi:hypothetical protein
MSEMSCARMPGGLDELVGAGGGRLVGKRKVGTVVAAVIALGAGPIPAQGAVIQRYWIGRPAFRGTFLI